jgi:hypothetical protein
MTRTKTNARRKVIYRIAPIACAALLGVGAAACGSGGTSHTRNAPTPTGATPAASTPSTTAAKSGGAGF